MLKDKKILLGITGGIAAYKSALLCRLLIKEGAQVRVIMTKAAKGFITPLTLATLSKHPVYSDLYDARTGEWHNHVDLGLWADVLLIAPATAHTLAKCAQGLCDNLLTATFLSAKCPVFFAPAMDRDMYLHPATQRNLQQLTADGHHIIPAEHGELASGLVGEGRMAEPEHIVRHLYDYFAHRQKLKGKKAIVTAGPTYEAIDPVRFIGNHSTGKMGYAIAEALAQYGAEVVLVSGPTAIAPPKHPNIELFKVTSAREMLEVALDAFREADIAVLAAAVADYRPKEAATQKIKKKSDSMQIELVKNPDIAATLGQHKKPYQFMVGFALETENEEANAREKLRKKNFDFIVLNSLNDEGAGFGHDTNSITILTADKESYRSGLKSKKEIAYDIVEQICRQMQKKELLPVDA